MAVAPVAYERARESAQYRSTLRQLISDLRLARHAAAYAGRPLAFQVDLKQGSFALEGRSVYAVPSSLELRVTTAAGLVEAAQVASIVFMPDGGATGGSVEVLRPSGGGARVRVDWLTGLVSQEPLLP